MKLLKLGRLSMQSVRWLDALTYFDEVFVLKTHSLEKKVEGLSYIDVSYMNNYGFRILAHFLIKYNHNPRMELFLTLLLRCLRYIASRPFVKALYNVDYDEVHVSWCDFDESAMLLVLLKPYLKKETRVTRSYKESRPQFNYMEKMAFKYADRIVLNDEENLNFFIRKYGKSLFADKKIIYGTDEDYIYSKYVEDVKLAPKLSSVDGKKHIVILSGRVFSDSLDERSGSRLFYIPLINSFIEAGFVVHLHTMHIEPDTNGINQYEELCKKYKGSFFIENPLSFEGDKWKDGYFTLSQYDYGILHNYIEGTSNTEFDRYNLPHRYYDYILSHVIPILLEGETIVLEKIIRNTKGGRLYKSPEDLFKDSEVLFKDYSFKQYIKELYGN